MKSGDDSTARLEKLEKLLSEIDATACDALSYFVGKELDALGKKDEAEKYWRRSLTIARYDTATATLAGFELAKRHGTSPPTTMCWTRTIGGPSNDEHKKNKGTPACTASVLSRNNGGAGSDCCHQHRVIPIADAMKHQVPGVGHHRAAISRTASRSSPSAAHLLEGLSKERHSGEPAIIS